MFPFLCSWSYPLFLPSLRHKGKKSWQFFSSYQITPRKKIFYNFSCCSSVAKSCLTLCDPMVCMLGFPVLHHFSEFSQTHVQWVSGCHPTISSSVTSFSSCFYLSQHQGLSQWVGSSHRGPKSIGASALASVLPMNIQSLFPLGLTGLISMLSKGLSRVFSSTKVWKHQCFGTQPSLWSISHIHTGKTIALTRQTFVGKVMSLLFNTLVCHSFSSKEQVSFHFMAAVTILSDFGAQENEVCYSSRILPIYLPWSDGTGCHDLKSLNVEL